MNHLHIAEFILLLNFLSRRLVDFIPFFIRPKDVENVPLYQEGIKGCVSFHVTVHRVQGAEKTYTVFLPERVI